jgi:hypothetical protein
MDDTTGWADDRLKQAHDLIDAVRLEAREAGIFLVVNALTNARRAIDAADVALEEERAA